MPVVSFAPSQDFLNEVRTDIAALPQGAVEIAAALVSMQFALPVALVDWLIAEEESLKASPVAALKAGRKAEVRRIAQALL